MTLTQAREIAAAASWSGHGIVVVREALLEGGFATVTEQGYLRALAAGVVVPADKMELWRDGEIKENYHADSGGDPPPQAGPEGL